MTKQDRARRQSLADIAGRAERRDAFIVSLHDMLRAHPLETVEAMPLQGTPPVLRGHPIDLAEIPVSSMERAEDVIARRLEAELARLLRIAPAVPPPWAWRLEVCEEEVDFKRGSASIRLRLVLEDTRTGETIDPSTKTLRELWGYV